MTSVTSEFVALVLAAAIFYLAFCRHKVRVWRMVGNAGLILIGIAFILVADSIPFMVLFLTLLATGGIGFISEVTALVK